MAKLLDIPFLAALRERLLGAPYEQRVDLHIPQDDTDTLEEIQMAVRDRSVMAQWGLLANDYVGIFTDGSWGWYFVKFRKPEASS